MGGRQNNQPIMKTIATVALCAVGAQAQWSWTTGGIPIPGSPGLVLNPLSQAVVPENSPQWHLEALRGQGLQVSVNGAITPEQTPEWKAAAARNAVAPTVKREAEAEPWYGWRGYSGAPIAGGALVIGQNSVTPDYTPAQKGAAWGLSGRLLPPGTPMPTTDMEAMVDTDLVAMEAMADMAMAVLDTATEDTVRGLLTLRPMPITAMAAMEAMALVAMEAMADTVRGLLTLRPMPTTDMAVLVMVLGMVVMPAMAAMAAAMATAATPMANKLIS